MDEGGGGAYKSKEAGKHELVSELMRGGNCRDGNSVLAISRMLLRSTSTALLSSASLLLLLTLPASNGADEGMQIILRDRLKKCRAVYLEKGSLIYLILRH